MHTASVVDLFCGAGGLSLGLQQSGLNVVAGIDNDPACRFPYETNIGAKFIERDVADLTDTQLSELYPNEGHRILAACSPCQPFSGLSRRYGDSDDRWELLLHVQRLVLSCKPHIVSLENVSRLAKLPPWSQFVKRLKEAGYSVAWDVKDTSSYGVPQKRSRLVMLASLLSDIELPDSTTAEPLTVFEAIGHLPPVAAGVHTQDDLLHRSRNLTPANIDRIRASRPSGTWKEWPEELKAACHVRDSGKTYPSVYGRMAWDAPAPTITTQFYGFGNGRFGHPEQDRALTLREGALLQSFPDNFQFVSSTSRVSFKEIGRLIGNAVPPKLGKAIGRQISEHLENTYVSR